MFDQIFGRMFASQWIVFVGLVILLVGLSELAWRMGLASSREKSEGAKDSGTVRSAVLALLGLLLGFSFAIALRISEIELMKALDVWRVEEGRVRRVSR
jgi:hypothetical protein